MTIENSGDGALLRVAGSDAEAGWGTPGQNGAQATVIAEAQQLTGDIVVDTQSQLALRLTEGSTLTGSVQILQSAEESAAEETEETAVVTIEKGSRWELTADCVISALYNEGEIDYNGYTITLADGHCPQRMNRKGALPGIWPRQGSLPAIPDGEMKKLRCFFGKGQNNAGHVDACRGIRGAAESSGALPDGV